MNIEISRRRLGALATGTLAATASRAQEPWPSRPLRLVVPYAPGGSTDQTGRLMAERMSRELGQPVVVENRPGASTITGTDHVAKSPPDGYTMLMASSGGVVLNPMLYRRLPFKAEDLQVLSMVVDLPLLIVANPALPFATLPEFVIWARGRSDDVNHAVVGLGNSLHLAMESLRLAAGFGMQNVVFPGSAPALNSLLRGDVHVMVDVVSTSLPYIRDGKLRPLAVLSRERLPVLEAVPTIAESGYRGLEASTWFGIAVPRGLPQPVADRLRAAIEVAQADPEVRRRLTAQGLVVQPPRDPAALAAMMEAERRHWAEIIRARNIVLD